MKSYDQKEIRLVFSVELIISLQLKTNVNLSLKLLLPDQTLEKVLEVLKEMDITAFINLKDNFQVANYRHGAAVTAKIYIWNVYTSA